MWRALRLLAAAVVRNEELLREGFRRVAAADEERIRRATAAAEESRKAEAEAREARRAEDAARRKEAEAHEARRQEDAARRLEDAVRRAEDAARRAEEAAGRAEKAEAHRKADEARRQGRAEAHETREEAEEKDREVRRQERAEAQEAREKSEEKAREARRLEDNERERRFHAMIAEGIRERQAEAEESQRKLDEAIYRQIGEGDPRRGRLVAALTEGDLPPILREVGIEAGLLLRRPAAWRNGACREWDLFAVGERATVVVEIEPTLRVSSVRRCRSRLRTIREWRADFNRAGMRVHGALAYLSAKEAALRFAENRGLLLIGVDDSGAGIRNSPGFEPAVF